MFNLFIPQLPLHIRNDVLISLLYFTPPSPAWLISVLGALEQMW